MEQKNDIWITCPCGESFIFSVLDQEFYEKNNYLPPKRCKKCRMLRQQERDKYKNYKANEK